MTQLRDITIYIKNRYIKSKHTTWKIRLLTLGSIKYDPLNIHSELQRLDGLLSGCVKPLGKGTIDVIGRYLSCHDEYNMFCEMVIEGECIFVTVFCGSQKGGVPEQG